MTPLQAALGVRKVSTLYLALSEIVFKHVYSQLSLLLRLKSFLLKDRIKNINVLLCIFAIYVRVTGQSFPQIHTQSCWSWCKGVGKLFLETALLFLKSKLNLKDYSRKFRYAYSTTSFIQPYGLTVAISTCLFIVGWFGLCLSLRC